MGTTYKGNAAYYRSVGQNILPTASKYPYRNGRFGVNSPSTGMDVERLPSGKFATNELVLELTVIAYNLLRMIGQESLRHKPDSKRKVRRRRIRTVIENIVLFASHITKHARETILALGRSNTWRHAFMQLWLRFITV